MRKWRPAFLTLFLATSLSFGQAPDFRWEPGTLRATVKGPDAVGIGQYLYIAREGSKEGEWNMAKLNLPESWSVKSLTVNPDNVELVTDLGRFVITPDNLGTLRKALLKPNQSEEEIEGTWKKIAAMGG